MSEPHEAGGGAPPDLKSFLWSFALAVLGARGATFVFLLLAGVLLATQAGPGVLAAFDSAYDGYRREYPGKPIYSPGRFVIGIAIAGSAGARLSEQLRARFADHTSIEIVTFPLPDDAGSTWDDKERIVRQWLDRTGASGALWGLAFSTDQNRSQLSWSGPTYPDRVKNTFNGAEWLPERAFRFPAAREPDMVLLVSAWITAAIGDFYKQREIETHDDLTIPAGVADERDAYLRVKAEACDGSESSRPCRLVIDLGERLYLLDSSIWDDLWRGALPEFVENIAVFDTQRREVERPEDFQRLFSNISLALKVAEKGSTSSRISGLRRVERLLLHKFPDLSYAILKNYPFGAELMDTARDFTAYARLRLQLESNKSGVNGQIFSEPHLVRALSALLRRAEDVIDAAAARPGFDGNTEALWRTVLGSYLTDLASLQETRDIDARNSRERAASNLYMAAALLRPYSERTPLMRGNALIGAALALDEEKPRTANNLVQAVGLVEAARQLARDEDAPDLEVLAQEILPVLYGRHAVLARSHASMCKAMVNRYGPQSKVLIGGNYWSAILQDLATEGLLKRLNRCPQIDVLNMFYLESDLRRAFEPAAAAALLDALNKP